MQSTELHGADLGFVVNLPLLKCQAEGIGTNLEEFAKCTFVYKRIWDARLSLVPSFLLCLLIS